MDETVWLRKVQVAEQARISIDDYDIAHVKWSPVAFEDPQGNPECLAIYTLAKSISAWERLQHQLKCKAATKKALS